MQSQNKMFDDLVKMVNGVAGTMAGMGREAEGSMREKMREWVSDQSYCEKNLAVMASLRPVARPDEATQVASLDLESFELVSSDMARGR